MTLIFKRVQFKLLPKLISSPCAVPYLHGFLLISFLTPQRKMQHYHDTHTCITLNIGRQRGEAAEAGHETAHVY